MTAQVRRCLLFVPGTRPDRFAKAVAAGAETACLDLEDSVPHDRKGAARAEVLRYFSHPHSGPEVERAIRLNALSTREGMTDLLALIEANVAPDLIVLPKVRDAAELRVVHDLWGQQTPALLATIESSAGLLNAVDIATRSNGGILFGAADLAAELNVPLGSELLCHARSTVILAAKAAGIDAIDTPFFDVHDQAGLDAQARRARDWGFSGMAAIHPCQIRSIQAAFVPTLAEIDEARRGLAAFSSAGGGACLLNGRLIEKPLVERFKRVLELAAEAPR